MFRGEWAEWKRFAGRLFLLLGVPFFLFAGLLEFVCLRTGETVPTAEAVRLQNENPHLIFMRTLDADAGFKLMRAAQERPDVLIMGNSRASQLRSAMFHPYTAYNLSRLAWTFRRYVQLLRQLPPDYDPKVILFNLDFDTFNPVSTRAYADSDADRPVSALENHLDTLRAAFTTVYIHPWLIFAGRHSAWDGGPSIGLKPAVSGAGFRLDGSETQNLDVMRAVGEDLHLLSSFTPNILPLVYGDKMGKQEMADFEEFVRLGHARHAVMIGVQMPIYGPVLQVIEQNPRYGILADFREHLRNGYFDRLGVIALDESVLPPYSDDYHYFTDAIHPTEAISAAMILKMDEDPRVKAALPDLDTVALRQALEKDRKAPQHVYLYGDQF